MTIRNAVLATVLVGLIGCGIVEAQQATIRPSPGNPVSPVGRSEAEQEAFFGVQNAATPLDRLRAANNFMSDYFESEFRHLVLYQDWLARGELQREGEEIVEAALLAIEAQDYFLTQKLSFINNPDEIEDLPGLRFTLANREALFYQSIVEAYLSEEDFDELVEYGNLALESQTESLQLYEAVGAAGTPEYDQTVQQIQGGQLFILNTLFDYYLEEDEFEQVVEYGDRILEVAPDTFVARTIMQGYQDEGDVDGTLRYGQALLEASPDDLNTLMTVSLIMAEQEPEGDTASHWEQTKGYAEQASEQLDLFLAGPDSAQLNDDQRAGFIFDVNSTLGFASLQTEEWADAARGFEKALEGTPDDANLYQMLALATQGNRDLEGMMSALARAVFLDHPDPQLRASLALIYENVNGSGDGLDEFIETEGEQIDN